MKNKTQVSAWLVFAIFAALLTTPTRAADPDDDDESEAAPATLRRPPRWHVEVKRQNTGRATPGESTKTTLRLEYLPAGLLTLMRLDLPFPDSKTTKTGSPFDAYRGDLKLRFGFRGVRLGDRSWAPFTEFSFPTADPPSLGAGSLQWTLGAKTGGLPSRDTAAPSQPRYLWTAQLQQTVALATEGQAKDVNYTKLELALIGSWGRDYTLKGTLKPTIDWVQDGKTGAVLEVEGGLGFGDGWHISMMGGALAWGSGVANSYGRRLELNLGRRF